MFKLLCFVFYYILLCPLGYCLRIFNVFLMHNKRQKSYWKIRNSRSLTVIVIVKIINIFSYLVYIIKKGQLTKQMLNKVEDFNYPMS